MKQYVLLGCVILVTALSYVYAGTTGRITGKITDSETGNDIEGVTVFLKGTNFSDATDSKGQFLIINTPPGKYTIEARKAGYRNNIMEDVNVKVDRTTSINFEMNILSGETEIVIVSGKVTDSHSMTPIEAARVIVEGTGMGAETNENGVFNLPALRAKVYTLRVMAEGYKTGWYHDLVLSPGPRKTLSLTVEREPTLVTETFSVKHRPVQEVVGLAEAEMSKEGRLIGGGSNSFSVTDTEERLHNIRLLLHHLDLPPKQVWLVVRLILASSEKKSGSGMPKELESISKQLKSLFRYQSYELLDDARIMAYEGEGCKFAVGKGEFRVSIAKVEYINANGGLIKLVRFSSEKDGKNLLATTVNIPNGDTLILGASNVDQGGAALITAVTAKTTN